MKSSLSGNRGGRRENAGRKAIWNNKDTTTIRVPKVIATQVMELAHRLDSGERIDFETKSIPTAFELVTKSKLLKLENITNSNSSQIEIVKKSIRVADENVTKSKPGVNEAIELATKILKHKKSAIHSVAQLISKLYSTSVSKEDLK